ILLQAKGLRDLRRYILHMRADVAAGNRTVLDQLLHDILCHVHRDGEADALKTTGTGEDCCIDTDQLATRVDQGATRVARVDGCICLNEVLVVFNAQAAAPGRADDPLCHRLPQAKRIPQGQSEVSNFYIRRMPEGYDRQIALVYLEYRKIRHVIGAYDFRLHFLAAGDGDGDFICAFNDVIIGQDVP